MKNLERLKLNKFSTFLFIIGCTLSSVGLIYILHIGWLASPTFTTNHFLSLLPPEKVIYLDYTRGSRKIIWIDPLVVGSIIWFVLLASISSLFLLCRKQTPRWLFLIIIGSLIFEILSIIYCCGVGLEQSYVAASLCPHLFYPRIGMIITVTLNLGALWLQEGQRQRWVAWICLIVGILTIMLVAIVLIVGYGWF